MLELKGPIGAAAAALLVLGVGQPAVPQAGDTGSEQAPGHLAVSSEGNMAIQIFGCVMPLPPGYVLRADAEPFFLYRRFGFGSISIKPYEAPDPSKFEILRDTPVGPLSVVQLKGTGTFGRSRPTLTYIHDGKTVLLIVGDDEDWADHMARRCLQDLEVPCEESAKSCSG